MAKTEKLYYEDMFLTKCTATVVEIKDNSICFERTVAYPEGGGQIADRGTIAINDKIVPFYDVKKGLGRVFCVPDFPTVNVDTPIYHIISGEDIPLFSIGAEVTIQINIKRRIMTTVHHSAIHLALMFATERKGTLYSRIKGCSITDAGARLDFALEERFSEDDIAFISKSLDEIILKDMPIYTYPYESESEAWYWKCGDFICPCGGTHVERTSQIGVVVVKRKGIGKGRERLIIEVKEPILSEGNYH